ncbi:MAG: hypothetical protein WC879_16880 [Melioribacteraceae bacterium]
METMKLRYKKNRKVFVPDKDVDLPDNFELEIEKPIVRKEDEMTDKELEVYVKKLREEFVKEFKEKYGIDMTDDPFLELIGSEAKYLRNTTYEDDKKRIIEAVSEKYNRRYNE